MCGWVQVESRCGDMSISWFGQSVQLVFVYVCLEIADFSMMFVCWDSVEPIKYGVGDMYVGCGKWFVACGSFVC